MTMNLPGAAVSAFDRPLPGPTSPDWDDPRVIERIAGLPAGWLPDWEATQADLLATYGTADPDALAAMGAIDTDIADARRHATSTRSAA